VFTKKTSFEKLNPCSMCL